MVNVQLMGKLQKSCSFTASCIVNLQAAVNFQSFSVILQNSVKLQMFCIVNFQIIPVILKVVRFPNIKCSMLNTKPVEKHTVHYIQRY